MGVIKAFFDDREKSINPAHVIALALTGASIIWVSWIVYHTRIMPDLSGVAYLLGGSGAMNVAGKMEDIIAKLKPQAAPVVPPPMVPPPMEPPKS